MSKKQEIMQWLLDGVQPGLSLSELTSKGIMSEETSDSEDITIITRTFVSHDGSFSKSITLYLPKESKEDVINELQKQIDQAVKEQDYLKAAELQKQQKEYLRS